MWAIDNDTPFAAERAFVRDRDGAEIWLVAVRATFSIGPRGELTVAKEQDPVAIVPQYRGEPGQSSLRCDIDLPRTKLGTDVLLNGSAYAPGGRAATEVEATLAVGPLRKSVVVRGDRTWKKELLGVSATDCAPFQKMPLTYERAYGGPPPPSRNVRLDQRSDENPVGVGLNTSAGAPLPNVEYPHESLGDPGRGVRAAGLGALSCSWLARRQLAGTYDDAWRRDRQPLLPLDFRDEYFYSAPVDQQVPGFLSGGEVVELTNLTPGGGLRFQLPRVRLGFRTWIDGGSTHHRANLHTVLIEPDAARVIMVWHTALPCHHTLYTLKRTLVFVKEQLSKPSPSTRSLSFA